MTDADNVMNLQHFWNDPVDIRIRIQISRNLDSNPDHFWSRLDACLNDGCLCCLITVYRVRQSEMFQHEIRYYLRNAWIFLHQLFNVELYVASCCIYLMYAKLTETQLSRTNFATEQKEWLGKHCPDFIDKDSWPPDSPDWTPTTTMCEEPCLVNSGSWNRNVIETTLQTIWNDLHDETIRKSVLSFCKSLMICVKTQGGHSNIRLMNLGPMCLSLSI